MSLSAKRYGIEAEGDLDLELRLRRIETELAKRIKIGDTGSADAEVIRMDLVPQVTGLRVTGKTVGNVSFGWNQVRLSNLRRYELFVAEDYAFTENLQRFNVVANEFSFNTTDLYGETGETRIYAKVRARTRSNKVGAFSTILSTLVGQAQTDDFADQSVTIRKLNIGPDTDPNIWTSENDGPGSGLDADTVDGVHAAELVEITGHVLNDFIAGAYEEYESTNISSTTWSTAHTIGTYPRAVQAWFECIEGQWGYSVGDRIPLGDGLNHPGYYGITVWINKTHLGYAWQSSYGPWILQKAASGFNPMDGTKWKFVVQLWK